MVNCNGLISKTYFLSCHFCFINDFQYHFCRPGASSGILLGAITLPAVMLAKMIQLTRAFSSNHIGLEGMGFLNKQ